MTRSANNNSKYFMITQPWGMYDHSKTRGLPNETCIVIYILLLVWLDYQNKTINKSKLTLRN